MMNAEKINMDYEGVEVPDYYGEDGLLHCGVCPLCGFQHAVHYDFGQVVTFTDNRSADAAGYGTYHFRHYDIPPFLNLWTLPPLLFYGLLPK